MGEDAGDCALELEFALTTYLAAASCGLVVLGADVKLEASERAYVQKKKSNSGVWEIGGFLSACLDLAQKATPRSGAERGRSRLERRSRCGTITFAYPHLVH